MEDRGNQPWSWPQEPDLLDLPDLPDLLDLHMC